MGQMMLKNYNARITIARMGLEGYFVNKKS